ncbi:hypothetical protein PG987_013317 [Apiospora arundinis]
MPTRSRLVRQHPGPNSGHHSDRDWPDCVAPIGVDTNYLTEHVTDDMTVTKWIPATSDFGTATINVTTGGVVQTTTIPEGFKVTNTEGGLLEIGFSPYIKDIIAEYLPKLPSCDVLGLVAAAREEELAAANSTYIAAANSTVLAPGNGTEKLSKRRLQQRAPATECARRRGGRMSQLLGEDARWVQQTSRLDAQLVQASGSDAAGLASEGEALALMEEDAVAELILEEMAFTVAMEELVLLYGAFFTLLASVAFVFAVYELAVGLWKITADSQPMPIYEPTRTVESAAPTPTGSSCPISVPCVGDRCQGAPDGTCSGEDFKGCPCAVSGSSIGDASFWGDDFDYIVNLISGFQIPEPNNPQCVSDTTDDTVTIENGPWQNLFESFCNSAPVISAGHDYCLAQPNLPQFHIQFDYNSTTGCQINCHDAFDGLRDQCSYTSHTKYKEGYTEVSCGLASYAFEQCQG